MIVTKVSDIAISTIYGKDLTNISSKLTVQNAHENKNNVSLLEIH